VHALLPLAPPHQQLQLLPPLIGPVEFHVDGDQLLVETGVRAKARGSGIELEESWAHLFTLRDGRPVRLEAFTSAGEALAALAYPDQP